MQEHAKAFALLIACFANRCAVALPGIGFLFLKTYKILHFCCSKIYSMRRLS